MIASSTTATHLHYVIAGKRGPQVIELWRIECRQNHAVTEGSCPDSQIKLTSLYALLSDSKLRTIINLTMNINTRYQSNDFDTVRQIQ
jgi:hypothetical protein